MPYYSVGCKRQKQTKQNEEGKAWVKGYKWVDLSYLFKGKVGCFSEGKGSHNGN
jgi:hypothetical protein